MAAVGRGLKPVDRSTVCGPSPMILGLRWRVREPWFMRSRDSPSASHGTNMAELPARPIRVPLSCFYTFCLFVSCALMSEVASSHANGQAPSEEPKTIRETIDTYPNAFGDDGLRILSSPLKACDLGVKLQEEGPWTFFAPTNKATRDLGQNRLMNWLIGAGDTYELLQSHMVAGRVNATEFKQRKVLRSINGKEIRISVNDSGLRVNDSNLVESIECSNGTIHIIDRVLLPRKSLWVTLVEAGKYKTLTAVIEEVGLRDRLEESDRLTLFAPTDQAFEKLPYSVDQLLRKPGSRSRLEDILSYHVVPGAVSTNQITSKPDLATLQGGSLEIRSDRDGLMVNASRVNLADVACTNGTIHEIDAVLVPPERQQEIDEFLRREVGRQQKRYADWLDRRQVREFAQLKEFLKRHDLAIDREIIGRYLRLPDADVDPSVAEALIEQLGAKHYLDRVAAERSLMNLPVIPAELLRKAASDDDVERAVRARRILRDAIPLRLQTVESLLRAVELSNISGLMEELLATVQRYSDQPSIVESAKRAIAKTVSEEDIPVLSANMKADASNTMRHVSINALRRLRVASLSDAFVTWAENEQLDESTRLQSILALADLGDRQSLRLLVDLMVGANSPSIRARSAVGLRELTGRRFGFYVYATQDARAAKVEGWRQWIASEGRTARLNFPLRITNPPSKGATLVSLSNAEGLIDKGGTVIQYDESLKEVWRYDCAYPLNAEKMENGNILITERGRVIEVTPEKSIVRQHRVNNAYSARPLANGNFLVTHRGENYSKEGGAAFEIDPQGAVVWKLPASGRWNEHAIRMRNGHTLAVEVLQGGSKVTEFDANGRRVWSSGKSWSSLEGIQALEDGHVLITVLGTGVFEINKRTNDLVWQFPCDGARDAHRTKSDTTLVLTGRRIFEVNSNGEEIWSKDVQTVAGTIRR